MNWKLAILGLWAAVIAGPQAHAQLKQVMLGISATETASLRQDSPSVRIGASWPGPHGTGVCGFELRTHASWFGRPEGSALESLFSRLRIEYDRGEDWLLERGSIVERVPAPYVESNAMVHIPVAMSSDLAPFAYAAIVTVSTVDGRSLRDAIDETLGVGAEVLVLPRFCQVTNVCADKLRP